MPFAKNIHKLAWLVSLLACSGCDWQSTWSKEYHLRQCEEFRTLGDRARVNDKYRSAQECYQKAYSEMTQAGVPATRRAQGLQDIAESELLLENLAGASLYYEKALQLYKANELCPDDQLALARCLTGYGVTLLKKKIPARAESILQEAAIRGQRCAQSGNGKLSPDLACGWEPPFCVHSGKYWLLCCQDPLLKSVGSRLALAQLLADSSICQPVKRLVAQSYYQALRDDHDEPAARKIEQTFGLLRNIDTQQAAHVQSQWESQSKLGKKLDGLGKTAEARQAFAKALQISSESMLDCPLRRLTSLCNLAFSYILSGEPAPAVPLLKECVDIQQARFGNNDRALSVPRTRLGSVLLATGQMEQADVEIRRGYELAQAGYGNNSMFTARAECTLAALEIAEGKYGEAEKHVMQALPILSKDPQRNGRTILDARFSLIEIYKNTGEPEKCLRQAKVAASFARENGSYVDQYQSWQKLIRLCREQGKPEDELACLRAEKEIVGEALSNAKWQRWAAVRKKILQEEFLQFNSRWAKKGQP